MLDRETYLTSLARDAAAFAGLLREVDLYAAVPDCERWDVVDLASHLGGVHRWARDAVLTGVPGDEPVGPRERGALLAWFEEGAALLLDTLRSTDPGTECWTFGPKPRTASFWVRRQAHETAMHLRDLRRAFLIDAPLEPAFAADGVDEVVTMFFPRQVRLERTPPLAAGVRLVAADVPGASWVIAGDGTDPDAPSVATLTGTAEDLLLVLWSRGGGEMPSTDGDRAALMAVLLATLTP